jgi:hypothetical protein
MKGIKENNKEMNRLIILNKAYALSNINRKRIQSVIMKILGDMVM